MAEHETREKIIDSNYSFEMDKAEALNHALNEDNKKLAKKLLKQLHPADIADFIDSQNNERRQRVIELLGNQFSPQILLEITDPVRESIIVTIGDENAAKLINKMAIDDAVYILENIPHNIQNQLKAYLKPKVKSALVEELQYPEDSAGRVMTKDYVSVPENWDVGKVMKHLRTGKNIPDDFHDIFVIDKNQKPIGTVKVMNLIKKPQKTAITDIMQQDIHIVNVNTDQDDVSYVFKQYDLSSVPVTNELDRLIGVIDIDDIIEVIDDEAEEDLMHMGGVKESDLHLDYFNTIKQRFPWLFINLLTAIITAILISMYQDTISHIIIVAAIMQIVASMGGNAGTQTATISVRAIATKDITSLNSKRVVLKEIVINAINGFLLAVIGFFIILTIFQNFNIALIFSVSVIISFAMAGLFGSMLPLILNKLNIDPALASGIFLTAITDIIGFFVFLFLVTLILL